MAIKYLEIPDFTISNNLLTHKVLDEDTGKVVDRVYEFGFLTFIMHLLSSKWWKSGNANEARMRSDAALRLAEIFEEVEEKELRWVPVEDADLAMLIERAQEWQPEGNLAVLTTKMLKFFRVLLAADTKEPKTPQRREPSSSTSSTPAPTAHMNGASVVAAAE